MSSTKDTIVKDTKAAMEKRLKQFEADLSKVRTGRASINILDAVRVDYYGTPTPLNQVATLSTPDPRMIVVAPFEKKSISDIEKAIMKADIGIQPTNDGNVVRLPIPALTEERRKDLVKQVKKVSEDMKVAIRGNRRDANDAIKKFEKDKAISQDEQKRLEGEIQKITDQFTKMVDDRVAAKEKEIMTV